MTLANFKLKSLKDKLNAEIKDIETKVESNKKVGSKKKIKKEINE